ncbi:mechanosensitive ion channel family protein [Nocardia cyriacigeorgica]|uniref:mechanosensitive ion channel family protein n=1 Tax=Nocardia cyriacigeorgica TaxID=135487 RepID=UPI0002EAEA5B|nr:mechanosensitive ion channel domain-containing protein [Nocardia cyriacigeorgica]AVH24143.1 mechanosensitive ion channel protein [Nocardia cyriacigeorgica]PPJ05595.1 mechanosensitive ion channel protein [Nocardia cyriacigeorgica]TLF59904.1 mechanosensitive ion channel [Nocardia cyriacigeorgica]
MEDVLRPLIVFCGTIALTVVAGLLFDRLMRFSARKRPDTRLPLLLRRVRMPLQVLLGAVALHATYPLAELELRQDAVIRNVLATMAIMAAVWLVIRAADAVADNTLSRYAQRTRDVARVRQLRTQLALVRRIVTSVLVVTTAAVAILLLFPGLRTLGTSLLASAGVIGIIAGVAAQSTLSNLMAGLQIAFGDSVKIGDTVVVEGEMGTVEEITLAFLTVRIWDDRRLTMPVSYFNSKPYENWSRGGSELTGTVFLHLDHSTPVPLLREHLHEYLKQRPDWDGRSWNLLVTDSTPTNIVVRAAMSAADSDDVWTLRCAVREELLDWLGRNHPYALPKISTAIAGPEDERIPALAGAGGVWAGTDGKDGYRG